MKKAFTFLFLVISMGCFAQTGITPGAKWAYGAEYFTGNSKSIYTYVKDSVIDSKPCAVLTDTFSSFSAGLFFSGTNSNRYVYIKNDSMYWYIDSAFKLTCTFNCQEGDTVEFYYTNRCDTFLPKFVVDSVVSKMYQNNQTRKVFYYRLLSPTIPQQNGFPYLFRALESVGWLNAGQAVYATCMPDDVSPYLQCFKDDSINLNSDPDCFKTITSIGDSEKEPFLLSSNIVTDWLMLNISSPTHLTLFDINGRLLFERNVSENTRIDVSNYPTGMYLLKARSKEHYKTYKVFKTL